VGHDSAGPLPPELRTVGEGPNGFLGFALPVGWAGDLQLLVGAPADEGEAWARFSDATAPLEALACRVLTGRRAGAVVDELADAPASVRYRVDDGGGSRLLPPAQAAAPPWSDWLVVAALGTRAHEVVIPLAPPGAPVPPSPPRPEGCGP
jgi:hypothetical protein